MLFLLSIATLKGQINPINNLSYQQFYDLGDFNCPAFNCFILSWQPPDSTNDTLIGYKVYRNGEFYAFSNGIVLGCSGLIPCNYNDWYSMIPFWVTVKAIYNYDSLESVVNDSVEVTDIAIYVKENEQKDFSLLKNPILPGENISLLIPNSTSEKLIVKVISPKGQILKYYEINNVSKSVICLPTTGLEKGLYFINIEMREQKMTFKLLIE
jgi:hypothetical protein